MDEIWKPVVGFEDCYSVSNLGRVRSEARRTPNNGGWQVVPERILKLSITKSGRGNGGYPVVNLSAPGRQRRPRLVHRLVLEAFEGPCPSGMEAAHGDGNRANPALSNLRWATPTANNLDKVVHGTQKRGEQHQTAKLTEAQVLAIKADQRLQRVIANEFGISPSNVSLLKSGNSWKHL